MYDAKAIKELRKQMGITAAEFGKLVGVTESTICYWESGKRHPAWKHLVKLNELGKEPNAQLA